jgi:hypothetical protein
MAERTTDALRAATATFLDAVRRVVHVPRPTRARSLTGPCCVGQLRLGDAAAQMRAAAATPTVSDVVLRTALAALVAAVLVRCPGAHTHPHVLTGVCVCMCGQATPSSDDGPARPATAPPLLDPALVQLTVPAAEVGPQRATLAVRCPVPRRADAKGVREGRIQIARRLDGFVAAKRAELDESNRREFTVPPPPTAQGMTPQPFPPLLLLLTMPVGGLVDRGRCGALCAGAGGEHCARAAATLVDSGQYPRPAGGWRGRPGAPPGYPARPARPPQRP